MSVRVTSKVTDCLSPLKFCSEIKVRWSLDEGLSGEYVREDILEVLSRAAALCSTRLRTLDMQ